MKLTKTELGYLVDKVSELGILQTIERKLVRSGGDRMESTAEHSWQLAMTAWLLLPYYEKPLNVEKVLKLALVHDVVEIYAGDTFAFDHEHKKTKHDREDRAVEQLFNEKLSEKEMKNLWKEYALRQSEEARYVAGLDKLVPMIRHTESNLTPKWKGVVTEAEMRTYKEPQLKHSLLLTELFEYLIEKYKKIGHL